MPKDVLITAMEAGNILGVSVSTIRRKAESGELAYAQRLAGPNGAYLFRRSDVLQLAADQARAVAEAAS